MNELVALRKKTNLSQAEFSKKIGISQSNIAKYELLHRFPRREYLNSIKNYANSIGLDFSIKRFTLEHMNYQNMKKLDELKDEE